MSQVYFDNAATTAIRPEVLERMIEVMREVPGNPSSTHAVGRKAKSIIEQARKTIAGYLHVTPAEIVFTSGGTEADNLIINSAVRDLGVRHIITSPIEHHAVIHVVEHLQLAYDIKVSHVNIKECGSVDLEHLAQLLEASDEKTLISLMHINNEIGNMLDLETVAKLAKEHNALFHSDMVQSVGHFDLNLSEIPVDFIAAAAHKFHGPKGVGFAFLRKNSKIKSLIFGGGQERGSRAGTEPVHNIAGMETALIKAQEHLAEERAYIEEIKWYFKEQLEQHIPDVHFNGNCGDGTKSTYTLLNVCLPVPEDKALMLLFQLDLKGIACSKGSACQSGSDQGSHVLNAFLAKDKLNKPSIRFSFSHENTKEEVDYVVATLKDFIA
ncbi:MULTISPECIES: cysteine desulfurase family protein [Leeuwenhoekiella]|jgi:cysteine desulfurase|uniref:cysteine desulfurase n=1 Tax=Leeuwenhoekiella blandensis (strain CECT 7118 / CCUG 51940 / KCTC 22103 / MED217) TaxID=398720 RepID=A3XNR6_LEEBM|nr:MULTISPECIES: cysteine desulfurase family protein [Leeuwenhoekiella]EAQ48806.1 iron-sulfur cofactor synthesis [Leeuwenhoekiella blandensis MED217]MAO44177.1 cysteine desulfurase [Leeuwenhoekiella sp.]|tara:strand:+ start:8092 stop:9237 length:1146 start_codon:yes stop_codon:yes gene_type:complete